MANSFQTFIDQECSNISKSVRCNVLELILKKHCVLNSHQAIYKKVFETSRELPLSLDIIWLSLVIDDRPNNILWSLTVTLEAEWYSALFKSVFLYICLHYAHSHHYHMPSSYAFFCLTVFLNLKDFTNQIIGSWHWYKWAFTVQETEVQFSLASKPLTTPSNFCNLIFCRFTQNHYWKRLKMNSSNSVQWNNSEFKKTLLLQCNEY